MAWGVEARGRDADSVGREQARQRMQQDPPDAQPPRHGADVLPGRSAEADRRFDEIQDCETSLWFGQRVIPPM